MEQEPLGSRAQPEHVRHLPDAPDDHAGNESGRQPDGPRVRLEHEHIGSSQLDNVRYGSALQTMQVSYWTPAQLRPCRRIDWQQVTNPDDRPVVERQPEAGRPDLVDVIVVKPDHSRPGGHGGMPRGLNPSMRPIRSSRTSPSDRGFYGALPIIDEKDMLVDWKGGASSPGRRKHHYETLSPECKLSRRLPRELRSLQLGAPSKPMHYFGRNTITPS